MWSYDSYDHIHTVFQCIRLRIKKLNLKPHKQALNAKSKTIISLLEIYDLEIYT